MKWGGGGLDVGVRFDGGTLGTLLNTPVLSYFLGSLGGGGVESVRLMVKINCTGFVSVAMFAVQIIKRRRHKLLGIYSAYCNLYQKLCILSFSFLVFYMLDTSRVNGSTVRQLQINSGPKPAGKDTHPKLNQVPIFLFYLSSLHPHINQEFHC
jgi:hypothetical protein